ncbi:TetR family transcriptional regulator [Streptomyces sp. NPDC058463]|uniref:TetR family transcriptional regulator n=1 Tax=Streptomyces sp. NPDC058463 TaxID=3346510 RepID=UPI00364F0774
MVRQQRAERTRTALLRAAAEEMDELGYCGASLNRTCALAGVTMGALTFHFPTKDRLADAVIAAGTSSVDAAVRRIPELALSPLGKVRLMLLTVGGLLHHDCVVRAAARLSRELSPSGDWTNAWLPLTEELIAQAQSQGQLRRSLRSADVSRLFAYLCSGIEAQARERAAHPGTGRADDAVHQLVRLWDAVLHGLITAGPDANCSPPHSERP